ncbi:MAG: hypothetical protein OEZ34_03060 [Spirochaetia bacterium]|nr:hypothetical protein [Spirochaetia bacterium]
MQNASVNSHTFIIYEKLKKELNDYDFDIGPVRARKILIRALSIIPEIIVEESRNPSCITVRSISSPSLKIEVSIQNAIDSIMILWNEHKDSEERALKI